MKKALFPPIAVLAVILIFSLWNSHSMSEKTSAWRQQLRQIDTLAAAGNWPSVEKELTAVHNSWTKHQTYLHIVSEHDAVDDAEAMYRRAMAFAVTQEDTEFRAEVADLMDQLRLLAEMERFSIKNIL